MVRIQISDIFCIKNTAWDSEESSRGSMLTSNQPFSPTLTVGTLIPPPPFPPPPNDCCCFPPVQSITMSKTPGPVVTSVGLPPPILKQTHGRVSDRRIQKPFAISPGTSA